jgi:hypothetical protein
LEDLFHLPLSQQAFHEFEQVETISAATVQRSNEGVSDKWVYIWGNGSFSPKRA